MRPTTDKKRITRRGFIGTTTSALAMPWIVPSSALGADGAVAPSNRLTMGLIGRGCMGRGHLNMLVGNKQVQVMAVCDVDKSRCKEGKDVVESNYAVSQPAGTYKGCATYNNFQDMLARKDIDGVVIATPDHWHTPVSVYAAKAGKDIYCEKPVSMTIGQGRALVNAVRANNRIFQTGSQYRSMSTLHHAVPEEAQLQGNFGGLFIGERGWLNVMYKNGADLQGSPDSLMQEMKLKTRRISGANNHHDNWFSCIKSRKRPSSYEEIGHRAASLGHLVTASFRLGRSLKWDPAKELFKDDNEANALLSYSMREPWHL